MKSEIKDQNQKKIFKMSIFLFPRHFQKTKTFKDCKWRFRGWKKELEIDVLFSNALTIFILL